MKKILAFLLALSMVLALVACGGGDKTTDDKQDEQVEDQTDDKQPAEESGDSAMEISLWTYPVGDWGKQEAVDKLCADFKAETGITVKVEYLAYADGDDKVNTAIAGKNTPDLILEGPERLVANWGAHGYLVDLADMLDDTDKAEILAGPLDACTAPDGAVYEYPMCMTAHCMGINLDAFKAAGADKYIDLETRTWSTEDYFNAIAALNEKFPGTQTAVFCAGQGGDQGTRALVTNLYGGSFTDADHTGYTWADPMNVKALETLRDTNGVAFDASLQGGDEIRLFYQGVLKIANCWNAFAQMNPNSADTGAGLTMNGEQIVCVSFPTEDGSPAELQGGIWGFGVFDNGDAAKIDAAKKFIKYMCDSEHTLDAVKASNFFPARTTAEGVDISGVWSDNEVMDDYKVLLPYLGDYYQVTKGWAACRTEWWNMLQEVGNGADVAEVAAAHAEAANAAAAQ